MMMIDDGDAFYDGDDYGLPTNHDNGDFLFMMKLVIFITMTTMILNLMTKVTASSFRATDTLISKEARLVVRGRSAGA